MRVSSTPKLILVEDTYGVGFHRELLRKLGYGDARVEVYRLPVKECNPKLERGVKAKLLAKGVPRRFKLLIVIDTEGMPEDDAKRNVLKHFKQTPPESIRVVTVDPKHEAWLCVGLGLKPSKCASNPELELEHYLGKPYEKHHLSTLAPRINLGYLSKRKDFKEYVESLKWLLNT